MFKSFDSTKNALTFLEKKRTTESYFDKIRTKSDSTKRNTRKAIKHFEKFCKKTYGRSMDEVIKEILKFSGETKEQHLYEILQDFVNYLSDVINASTIRSYFAYLKTYISYMTLAKIHSEDIKTNINFPPVIEEEPYPLKVEEIEELLKYASPKRAALYLASASSGMRIQEMCKIKKRDLDISLSRILVKIPGKYTKNRKPRRTFISREAERYLKPILARRGPDDLVFADNNDSLVAANNEESSFARVRDKAGFDDLKYDSGIHKITIHSFRSFFITKSEKIHDGLGHYLSGHKKYMKRYERFSDQELLEFYIKVEPHLMIYDKNVESQEKLNAKIRDLEDRLQKSEEEQRWIAQNFSHLLVNHPLEFPNNDEGHIIAPVLSFLGEMEIYEKAKLRLKSLYGENKMP